MSGAQSGTREQVEAPRDLRPADLLGRMSAEERLRAYRAGALTRAERAAWAAVWPEEVPTVNDEFEWIALNAE